jgi:hypothetical protein
MESQEYTNTIELNINGTTVSTPVNRYPIVTDEIILSTLVKDEDAYIIQWIEFHLSIGITRFIIYDNSISNTLNSLLERYIKENTVILIHWPYPYHLPISGLSGQTTQQNHSIYAFQTAKFIGLFDVDEYINIQSSTNLHDFFHTIIKRNNINSNTISSFRLLNKSFYNPNNLPTDNTNFLRIYTCDTITKRGKEKNFVIPKNIKTFSIHTVTSGLPMYPLSESDIFFNHYIFLNKSDRGRNNTTLTDMSIMQHFRG